MLITLLRDPNDKFSVGTALFGLAGSTALTYTRPTLLTYSIQICSLGKAHIFKFLSLLAQGEGEVSSLE